MRRRNGDGSVGVKARCAVPCRSNHGIRPTSAGVISHPPPKRPAAASAATTVIRSRRRWLATRGYWGVVAPPIVGSDRLPPPVPVEPLEPEPSIVDEPECPRPRLEWRREDDRWPEVPIPLELDIPPLVPVLDPPLAELPSLVDESPPLDDMPPIVPPELLPDDPLPIDPEPIDPPPDDPAPDDPPAIDPPEDPPEVCAVALMLIPSTAAEVSKMVVSFMVIPYDRRLLGTRGNASWVPLISVLFEYHGLRRGRLPCRRAFSTRPHRPMTPVDR